jgi:hypothetical protein
MESPEAANEIACPIVLQALVGAVHESLSLPFTPFTYQILLAKAFGARARDSTAAGRLKSILDFMSALLHCNGARDRAWEEQPPGIEPEASVWLALLLLEIEGTDAERRHVDAKHLCPTTDKHKVHGIISVRFCTCVVNMIAPLSSSSGWPRRTLTIP